MTTITRTGVEATGIESITETPTGTGNTETRNTGTRNTETRNTEHEIAETDSREIGAIMGGMIGIPRTSHEDRTHRCTEKTVTTAILPRTGPTGNFHRLFRMTDNPIPAGCVTGLIPKTCIPLRRSLMGCNPSKFDDSMGEHTSAVHDG
jgi:hypothetical protein